MESRFSDLIILLASGINQRIMYFDSHPTVQSLSRDFVARLTRALEDSGQTHFSFGVHNGKFIRNGKYLVGPSIAGRSLIEFAERLGCGGFQRGKLVMGQFVEAGGALGLHRAYQVLQPVGQPRIAPRLEQVGGGRNGAGAAGQEGGQIQGVGPG